MLAIFEFWGHNTSFSESVKFKNIQSQDLTSLFIFCGRQNHQAIQIELQTRTPSSALSSPTGTSDGSRDE
jgi:hypothetical protein